MLSGWLSLLDKLSCIVHTAYLSSAKQYIIEVSQRVSKESNLLLKLTLILLNLNSACESYSTQRNDFYHYT